MDDDSVYKALIEQLFVMTGPTTVAELLAKLLRGPSPHRSVLDMVAGWLDPKSDDRFKLVVARRRTGKSPTKHVNDAALRAAVLRHQQQLGDIRGARKMAVGKTADQFQVSEAAVRKALAK